MPANSVPAARRRSSRSREPRILLWEVRTRLSTRIARVLFVLEGNVMVLLHGFIKKERKTPKADLDIAKQRLKKLRSST